MHTHLELIFQFNLLLLFFKIRNFLLMQVTKAAAATTVAFKSKEVVNHSVPVFKAFVGYF